MIIIEEFYGYTKKDFRFRERYWCEKLKSIINILTPIREMGEYQRLYYQFNC